MNRQRSPITLRRRFNIAASTLLLLLALSLTPSATTAKAQGGLMGGGELPPPVDDCISPEQRAEVEERIRAYETSRGIAPEALPGAPRHYAFFPQAGTLWQDLFIGNFTDLDPSPAIRDWDCTNYSYNGHTGHDVGILSFRQQVIGVPVFAALPGTVVDAHDGEPDMNTTASGQPSNYVVLDHGNTHYTWYHHLKLGSVAVSIGQIVAAGTQIGQTASSGNSTGPHLHFESRFNNTWYEPFAGACRAGRSSWINQAPIRQDLFVREFAFSPDPYNNYPNLPFDDAPRVGTFAAGGRTIYLKAQLGNLPANSTWRHRFLRPNGSTTLDQNGSFNNGTLARDPWYWWGWVLNLDQTGTWRLLLDINGQTVVDAPFLVVSSGSGNNRAPNAMAGVALDPPTPTSADVVFCRIQTSLVNEDPDYDVMRYRFQWTVNGTPVRDVTNAALSDAIPVGLAPAGSTLACTVTPSDGSLNGPSAMASATVSSAARDSAGIYIAATGAWFLRNSNSNGPADAVFSYGPAGAGLVALRGDWDGDGDNTAGLYDPATGAFFLRNSNGAGPADLTFVFGAGGAGLVPIAGDWNGDEVDSIGLYDPATGAFFLRNANSPGPADATFVFGAAGAGNVPIVGDWNNDRIDTVGLYAPATGGFFLRNTNGPGAADMVFTFGAAGGGFTPVSGDWNGDGIDSIGIYDDGTAAFFLKDANANGAADHVFTYGPAGAAAVVGNWDGI